MPRPHDTTTVAVLIPPNLATRRGPDVTDTWLAALPAHIADATAIWGLTVGTPFLPGGYRGWVAPVSLPDGTPAVLKCVPPGTEALEVAALTADAGRWLPRVLATRPGALLLEYLTGALLATQSDAVQVAALTPLWAHLRALTPVAGAPVFAPDPDDAGIEAAVAGDDALRAAWGTWGQRIRTRTPDAFPLVPVHGDLHEAQVFTTPRLRALDPSPALAPRAWDLEPWTRRYLDRRDALGLATFLVAACACGAADGMTHETLRLGLLWRAFTHYAQRPGALWRQRLLGLVAA